jgi:cytochrome c peroxidase
VRRLRGNSRRRCPKIRNCFIIVLACAAVNAAQGAGADTSSIPAYEWRLPPGFPRPAVPADNPMSSVKVELGRRLFHEPRLSSTGRYACASCHRPELAFTDGRPRALGATGESVKHSAMSLANVAYNAAFTWSDARVHSLESQMRQPLFNQHPVEMGLESGGREAVRALSAEAGYRDLFAAAFAGDAAPMSMGNLIKAIAAFERSLISGRSPFDHYVYDDDPTALSDSQKRGMALFFSARVGCAGCHSGLNFSGPLIYEGHESQTAAFANTGLYDVDGRGSYPADDRGLIDVTHRAADMGKFRVPTLRNVELTAPYMHDGSLASLEQVIDRYARGGRKNAHQDSRLRPLLLSHIERSDLAAFLRSLTDREFVDDPRYR